MANRMQDVPSKPVTIKSIRRAPAV
jgi:hypothetical protein